MSIVNVENLSKKYLIGHQSNGYRTLRDVLTDSLSAPFRAVASTIGRRQSGAAHQSALADQSSGSRRSPRARGRSEEFWALKDMSFEIKQGEIVGIIGRNGAGKSTLLKILSRITEPTSGRVRIRGRVASLLEVGTGFHPELTGRENVFLNGAILGMSREEIKRKFDEIVAFAEVERFLDTPVKRYSSGMYVRLAFAVAAHLEPEILIVDEVLAVGDAQFQKKCLGRMDRVARQGQTVLFVSHNMVSIKTLCNAAIRLSNGRLIERGEPDAVIRGYLEECSTSGGMVEVPESEHRIKSPLQIKRVEVLNRDLKPCETFSFGEEILIRLQVHAKESIGQVRVGVGLYAEGVRISTFHSPPTDFSGVAGLQAFTCKLPSDTLLPNFYSLHVGANSSDTGRGLDWVADVIHFAVESVNVNSGSSHDWRDWGLVSLGVSWERELLGLEEQTRIIHASGKGETLANYRGFR